MTKPLLIDGNTIPSVVELAKMQGDLRVQLVGAGLNTAEAMLTVNEIMRSGATFAEIVALFNAWIHERNQ